MIRSACHGPVSSVNGKSYHYDAYGNMTNRDGVAVEYDVFNKPTQIGSTHFSYGPDHERFKQVNGDRTTYTLNGGLYEEIVEGTATTKRSYVGGYLVRSTQAGQTSFTYLHKDHLGSVEAMTDQWGNLIDRMSFDPWGQRQYADWADGNPTGGDPDYYPTTTGYTGHEMLDQENLIHMGGRVYDPVIGRFMSADLYIQAPYNTQSFNRYSYVLNNPLSLVDPSGYAACEAFDRSGNQTLCMPSLDSILADAFVEKNSNSGWVSSSDGGSFSNVQSVPTVYGGGGQKGTIVVNGAAQVSSASIGGVASSQQGGGGLLDTETLTVLTAAAAAKTGSGLAVTSAAVAAPILALWPSEMGDGTLSDAQWDEMQPRTMYHYSPDEVLRGGVLIPNSFLTTDGTLSSQHAIHQLALSSPDGTPLYVHTFNVYSGQVRPADSGFISGNLVGPANGRVGFGIQYQSNVPLTPIGPSRPAN